tara:strand:+ start:258 stop:1085 length:828 start_codon:yes stop_codon:yes gene_type:complete
MPYIGPDANFSNIKRYTYTATGGETSKTGSDDNSNSLSFTTSNNVVVYLNGILLVATTDYNTSTSNTIAGLSPALSSGDVLDVIVYGTFSVADAVPISGGTFTGDITATTITASGDTSAGDNATMGYTSSEGLILTGQGSSTDVTIKNDADATVASIATGTTVLTINDDVNVVGRATGTVTTDNDGDFDLSVSNDWICTSGGSITLTFSNPSAGQSGNVFFTNASNHTISAHASVAINASALTSLSTSGTYHLTYYCSAASGGNTIAVSVSGALT